MIKKIFLGLMAMGLFLPVAISAAPVQRNFLPGKNTQLRRGVSGNWSGYAVESSLANPTLNSVSDVAGQWTVPKVTCSRSTNYSSVWLGIDGYSSATVEQLGTEQDCYRGRAYYSTWYEMYPQYAYNTPVAIKAGDVMSAEVKYLGANQYSLSLNDLTTNKSFQTTQTMAGASRTSAEWIVEAPSSWYGVLPLANFSPVAFTNSQATLSGQTGSINSSSWQRDSITMVNYRGVAISIPSPLSTDGTSFSVVR
ncbi:MAG: G1 family glutamic endopeptidase [Candidatus Saccharimonadia bacterium]